MHSLRNHSAKLKASSAPRTSNLRHQTKQKATWATQKKPELALGEWKTHQPEVEETVQEDNCCTRQYRQRNSQAQATKPSTSDEANCARGLNSIVKFNTNQNKSHNTRQTVREQMPSLPTPSAKLKASRAPRTSNLNLIRQTKQKAIWAKQATQKKNPS